MTLERLGNYLGINKLNEADLAWQAKWLKRFLLLATIVPLLLWASGLPGLSQLKREQLHAAFICLCWLMLHGVSWWLLWRGAVWQATLWVVTVLFILTVDGLFLFTGLETSPAVAFFVIIVLVTLFLGERPAIIFSALTIIALVAKVVLERTGIIQPVESPMSMEVGLTLLLMYFGMFVFLLRLTIRRLDRQLATLRGSEERYQALFEHAPIAIWEQDATQVARFLRELREKGVSDIRTHLESHPEDLMACMRLLQVLDVNETAVEMYHAADKRDLMSNLDRLLPEDSYDFVLDSLVSVAKEENVFTREIQNRLPDGHTLDVLFRWVVSPHKLPAQRITFVSAVDISEQKAAEAAQRQYARRLQILHDLSLSVLSMQTPSAVAETALDHLLRLVPCDQAAVALFDFIANKSILVASAGEGDFFSEDARIENPRFLESLRRGEHHLFPNLSEMAASSPALQELVEKGVGTMLIIPLKVQGALLGNVGLAARQQNAFTEEHTIIAEEISVPLAIGMQNTKLLEAEQRARLRTEALRKSSMVLNTSLEMNDVVELIMAQLTGSIKADTISVMLVGEDGLRPAAGQAIDAGGGRFASRGGQNWRNFYRAMQQTEPVCIPDTALDPEWEADPQTPVTRSWIGAPLWARGKLLGLISINRQIPNAYSHADLDWVAAFANQAALALGNARLHEDVQRYANEMGQRVAERSRELTALYDVTAVAAENLDLNTALTVSMRRTMDALKCHAGVIHIWHESEKRLERAVIDGLSDEQLSSLEAQSDAESLLKYVVTATQPILASRFTRPALPSVAAWQPFKTYIGAPMRSQGKTHGVLSVLATEEHYFSVEDVALLDSIADQIALAVENAQLQQQAHRLAVIEERNRLARDLHDSVTQSLYSLTLFAEATRAQAQAAKLQIVQEHAQTIATTAQQALKEMRLLLYELRKSGRDRMSLAEALRFRLDTVEKRSGIACTLQVSVPERLSANVQDVFFMVAQEALNNALKHAAATAVAVSLRLEQDVLFMEIKDDGCGFDVDAAAHSGGLGVSNMRERIEQLGGTLIIKSEADRGTTIFVQVRVSTQE